MSYLSGVGYVAMRLWSSKGLPSPLEYASMEKSGYTAMQLSRLPFPLVYVSREKSGYAATQL